ncbi:hypothetical protein [Aestuariimicrobium ganziense]|uniref:hypothetical protein n=1 Tax=Aestuariimicrobium ganziense TaxID=2773677 RepID=UPI0019415BE1|nr:hypothetical protein [Aestuariimicrobium ganziense]
MNILSALPSMLALLPPLVGLVLAAMHADRRPWRMYALSGWGLIVVADIILIVIQQMMLSPNRRWSYSSYGAMMLLPGLLGLVGACLLVPAVLSGRRSQQQPVNQQPYGYPPNQPPTGWQ